LNLKIEPIGIIKNTAPGLSDVLIYSDFEHILGNVVEKFEKGTKVLIIHKKIESSDQHQVQVTSTELINRKGNLLTVRGIEADNDSVIDVRLGN
jgi:DNA-binding PucR family transcriptional regulator